ncbi:DUF4376 domain-containing protein [Tepidicella xavieri]|uniref:Uncharacterized protein DUF4376 n=1 Tax=Tepidicella xavieri TaxID=360241 RepID=A0A4R6U8J7_9BURK|nr:DUF4376 domain-containing protein [Tepidicella xavieri]TDQ40945.1 uncharacterized protein DUF4376 [Tepidicella xavieri]
MHITEDRHLIVNSQSYSLPSLPVEAIVRAWSVPEDYRPDGVFISVTPQGGIEEVPACSGAQLIGEAKLEADPAAKLAAAKTELRARVNAERYRQETMPLTYLGKTFDADERSIQRITGAVQAAQAAVSAGAPFSIDWVCADNTEITLDAQQMIGMPAALMQRVYAVHLHARQLKAAVDAATTEADLAAIDIATGWPA